MKTRIDLKLFGGLLVPVAILFALALGNVAIARSAHKIIQKPDEVVPGLVLVKLSPEGATQFAGGASTADCFGPQSQTLNIVHADQALQAHSIMRYAPGNSQSLGLR